MTIEIEESATLATYNIGYLLSTYKTILIRKYTAHLLLEMGAYKHILFDINIEENENNQREDAVCVYLPEPNLVLVTTIPRGIVKDTDEDAFNENNDTRAIAFASTPTREARHLLLNIMSSRGD